jgi:hypothetical protein
MTPVQIEICSRWLWVKFLSANISLGSGHSTLRPGPNRSGSKRERTIPAQLAYSEQAPA